MATDNEGVRNRRVLTRQYSAYPAAVWGKELQKAYGRGDNKLQVLNNLSISVPRGSIYGLLGPSGCGKTTLLRSILGRLHLDSGHLIVLGDRPGTRGHKVPGSMVGYMPQETSLFPDLTIAETLRYFGTLHGMTSEKINSRIEFLLEFLTLPSQNRLINQLSGGQMRRVSFSVALLHEPELLILDEPTVGVDPLLREKIWDHLLNIAGHSANQTTIILTTHYIEEAKQADVVGFMRNGKILAEETPSIILEQHNLNSLESVFLKLCQEDKDGRPIPDQSNTDNCIPGSETNSPHHPALSDVHVCNDDVPLLDSLQEPGTIVGGGCVCPIGLPSARNILAQFIKNLILMRRNIGFLLFQFMLPAIQIVLFCTCIGNDPFGLRLAVINTDVGPLGQTFLDALDSHSIIQENYTNRSYTEAYDSARQLHTWGVISIGDNFTQDLMLRFTGGIPNDTVLNGSSIYVQLDMTNQQVAIILAEKIQNAFQSFATEMLKTYHLNPKLAELPIQSLPPVYGELSSTFTYFMAPGVLISITFFLATGLTTLVFVVDKKTGMMDRCLASGMVSFEIMLAHMFTQMLIVIVQVSILLIFLLLVFKVPCEGPLVWVVLLVLMQGFCGMALGVLISALCTEETSAIQVALGSYFPFLLISGIIWPLEAVPLWLRYISYISPLTFTTEAVRCVLARGLDMAFYAVWRGYLASAGWCIGLIIIGGIILRVKE